MKCLWNLTIFTALSVTLSDSQLLQPSTVNCKTFSDPLNCNAYYQCCVDTVILHKFCPVGMEWNQSELICKNNDRCQIDETLNEDNNGNESIHVDFENYMACMFLEGRRPRPPIIRPPNSGSFATKLQHQFGYMLLMVTLVNVLCILYN